MGNTCDRLQSEGSSTVGMTSKARGDSASTASMASMSTGEPAGVATKSVSPGAGHGARETWTGRMDFVLSCIGYAVGLGNIWRFPYLCYRNGGAVFLVPYVLFLVVCGMPLVMLEVSYGQFASLSPITIWRLSPLFKGVGYGMVLISGIVCIYYNIIITWTLYYLFMSFQNPLPWATCDNSWNTDACVLRTPNSTYGNDTSNHGNTSVSPTGGDKRTTPSEEYWERHVLEITDGIEDMGTVRLELLGCLALAWVLVFLCLIKGIKSSGKVVYVTATFPYLILAILLVRGVTLPGALEGIRFYVIPQWDKLFSLTVWGEAAMQIFYSIGAAWGALITMASYNKFHNNCYRDAILVPILNACTSIFAGFVIFSIIGFMAHETGARIEDVVTQGPGLVFVVYPAAVARMPVSPLWAVLFFLMLFAIGLDSQFGMFETMTSAFADEFPKYLKSRKMLMTAALCFLEFLLGIPCIMQGGIYYLQIMDWYSSTFSLMIMSFTECVVVAWIYGANRFYSDIELMVGRKPCLWYKLCWSVITPSAIMFVLLFSMVSLTPVTYGEYTYPTWALGLGWVFALCSVVPLPLIALIELCREHGPIIQRLKKLVQPTADWGPALEENRSRYLASLSEERRRRYGHHTGSSKGLTARLVHPETVLVDC